MGNELEYSGAHQHYRCLNKILIGFTTTATAIFGVYFKLQSFVFMPVFGLNNGMVPIVAYNFGAQKPELRTPWPNAWKKEEQTIPKPARMKWTLMIRKAGIPISAFPIAEVFSVTLSVIFLIYAYRKEVKPLLA